MIGVVVVLWLFEFKYKSFIPPKRVLIKHTYCTYIILIVSEWKASRKVLLTRSLVSVQKYKNTLKHIYNILGV